MINTAQLRANLVSWVSDQVSSGVKVIQSDPNAPGPNETYLVVRVDSLGRVGRGWIGDVGEAGTASLHGTREAVVSIMAIGVGAMEELERVSGSLEIPTVLESLQENNLAFVRTESELINLTGVIGSRREERASLDLRFRLPSPYAVAQAEDDVGAIEHVEITDSNLGKAFVVNPPLGE